MMGCRDLFRQEVSVEVCARAQSTAVSRAELDSPAWGLLLGAGVERRLDRHWTARLEYRFMTFREELALPAIDGPGWEHNIDVHSVSFGLSYRFKRPSLVRMQTHDAARNPQSGLPCSNGQH